MRSLVGKCIVASLMCLVFATSDAQNSTENNITELREQEATTGEGGSGKILSRKKRYLTFPEGSSLQLIYCLTIPVLAEIDYAYGYTVSLAWQLPTDTRLFLDKLPRPFNEVIHRRDRRDIYSTIETFLQAHGLNGRACVLKGLCESAQRSSEKGEFLEELLHAIFSLPQADESESGLPYHYDEAYQTSDNCTELYPDCPTSLFALALS